VLNITMQMLHTSTFWWRVQSRSFGPFNSVISSCSGRDAFKVL